MKITITLSGGWGNPDPRMIYKVNRHGHHGSNFVHNPDILALGCSVTAGCGLPYDLTWPHLVARELNQTVNVISHPGASIQRIFNNFICYAKEFGLPKKILFPFTLIFFMFEKFELIGFEAHKQKFSLLSNIS